MTASNIGTIILNVFKLIIAKLAPVILHDVWNTLVAAWPQIKAQILKDVPDLDPILDAEKK